MRKFQEFPKWKYHPEKEPLIVRDADAESALGQGWFDNPGDAKDAKEAIALAESPEELVAEIAEILEHAPKAKLKKKAKS